MRLFHPFLVALYVALPIAAVAVAAVAARRQRSAKPLWAFGFTCLAAAVTAITVGLVYARATSARLPVGQAALACYLLAAVMFLLKGLNWGLREVVERAWAVHRTQTADRRRGGWWAARHAGASLTRAAVLFAFGVPYVMAVGMAFRPKVVGGDDPKQQLGAAFEPVAFDATDGVRLAGWWIPAGPRPNARPAPGAADDDGGGGEDVAGAAADWGRRTVVLCHGLGANKSNQLALARDLVPNGYNVLAFDFRAHGDSGGQLSTFGDLERRDVLGAVRWVRANRADRARQLFGLGVSMGGAAVLAAAGDPSADGRAIDAVAVFSTYDSFADLADTLVRAHFVPPFDRLLLGVGVPLAGLHAGTDLRAFRPADAADRLAPRPLMVVHGRGDVLIPFATGVRLYDGASQPKVRLWVGERNEDTGEYLIRTNPRPAVGPDANKGGRAKLQPVQGPPADHNNVLFDDAAVRAVRLFFDNARSVL